MENVRISLARPAQRRRRWPAVSVCLLLALLAVPSSAAGAQGQVTYTLNIKSAFAHTQPDNSSQRAASLFRGQTFLVNARTDDGLWVRLDFAGARTEVWMVASLGTIGGRLKDVPVEAAALPENNAPVTAADAAWRQRKRWREHRLRPAARTMDGSQL